LPSPPGARNDLSALDPGKQGLKPYIELMSGFCKSLSALDPGKQGLKQAQARVSPGLDNFQRLIQENKD